MRLNELTNPNKPLTIMDKIKVECTQILQLYKSMPGKYFYRGTKRDVLSYKKSPPQNRHPRDSNKKEHAQIVRAMKKLGFNAHRGNSAFVTPNFRHAAEYTERGGLYNVGEVYIIFPINGFQYTWSPKVYDLYGAMLDGRIDLELDDTYGGSDADNFIRQVKKLGYKSTDLEKALRLNCEVMIKGRYYGINASRKKDITAFIRGLK